MVLTDPTLVAKWRRELFTDEEWMPRPDRPSTPGEAGGFYVVCRSLDNLGYLKPTVKCSADTPRAANEKIVSDLGFDLGVSVPPVLLYRRGRECPEEQESRACISLVCFDEVWEWADIEPLAHQEPVKSIVKSVLAKDLGIIAFDTWIGNTDRSNDRNAILGVNRENPLGATFMFLDHAFSLNNENQWQSEQFRNVAVPPFPPMWAEALDPAVLSATLERIEELPDSTIEEMVNRVPDDYLDVEQKEIIITGLHWRKHRIRATLAHKFNLYI